MFFDNNFFFCLGIADIHREEEHNWMDEWFSKNTHKKMYIFLRPFTTQGTIQSQ